MSGRDGASGTGANGVETGTAGTMTFTPCPTAAPPNGSACSTRGLVCGYGDDIRGDICRTIATCSAQQWKISAPDAVACPPLPEVGACPADLKGSACAESSTCTQVDGNICFCTNCPLNLMSCMRWPGGPGGTGGVGPPTWYCPAPSTVTGCPLPQPNVGEACPTEGVNCSYDQFVCGQPEKVCSHGVWVSGSATMCPVSTRRAKKDIHYLSSDEIDALARSALDLRLATYEYRSAPYAGRRHLGFIIEDSPDAVAVDRDRDIVDLYGYTSMLLGTVQRQQRDIVLLRRQVEALSRTILRPRIQSPAQR